MSRIRPDQLLLPSVLDRLIDDEPHVSREAPRSRAQLLRDLKQSVRRDLENLLNSRVVLYPIDEDWAHLQTSVLNYGIPDFVGLHMGTREQRIELARKVELAIQKYETRFKELRVELVGDRGNLTDRTIRFRIEGLLHAEPAPEPVVFDSQLRPQSGDFEVKAGSS